jgi:hypothetical protein
MHIRYTNTVASQKKKNRSASVLKFTVKYRRETAWAWALGWEVGGGGGTGRATHRSHSRFGGRWPTAGPSQWALRLEKNNHSRFLEAHQPDCRATSKGRSDRSCHVNMNKVVSSLIVAATSHEARQSVSMHASIACLLLYEDYVWVSLGNAMESKAKQQNRLTSRDKPMIQGISMRKWAIGNRAPLYVPDAVSR